jgi:chromosome partitioning protein
MADLVLVPVRPSPHDLRAVVRLIEMLEAAQAPFCFVVNGATPRSTIAMDAVRALAQHGKVAPSILHNRVDFATSMIDGRTVGELNHKSRSAGEVTELWKYVSTQLHKYMKGRTDG